MKSDEIGILALVQAYIYDYSTRGFEKVGCKRIYTITVQSNRDLARFGDLIIKACLLPRS